MIHNTGIKAETAGVPALAVDGPQPVWMTLNAARERAFTGEIVFETDPEVFAYLDNGMVYYAERASDASLGRRLLHAGVVDVAQLERGTVRVGDIEHLGRLFDRDPSVDRDAVLVLAETTTQELITELANRSIVTVRFIAYRHHPSGVHRWFVAPSEPAAMTRPVSAVAQLDTTVLDELPALPFEDADIDDLVIEWDDEIDDIAELHTDVFELSPELGEFTGYIEYIDADAFSEADAFTDVDGDTTPDADADVDAVADVDAEAVVAPAAAPTRPYVGPVDEIVASDVGEAARADYEFSVVWPDGSEETATESDSHVVESATSLDEPSEVETGLGSDDGSLRFTMPPLDLSDEPDKADVEVPDDVAEAVRRAIAAIESASVAAPGAESFGLLGEAASGQVLTEPPTTDVANPAPTTQAPAGERAGRNGFAPPTMATHAEVLYAQMHADGSTVDAAAGPDPAEDGADSGNDRSSALRRLIGSLRRNDN